MKNANRNCLCVFFVTALILIFVGGCRKNDSVSANNSTMFYQEDWSSPGFLNMGAGASVRCIKDPGYH